MLRRGIVIRVKTNEVLRLAAVLNVCRERNTILVRAIVSEIIQVAMSNRSWAPKARILV